MFINKVLDTFLVIFTILVIAILVAGDRTYPKVSQINLAETNLPVATTQMILSFNREVDRNSVEESLTTEPPLQGRFSWIGRKMAYTFDEPLNYNQSIKISLKNAVDAKEDAIRNFEFNTTVEPKKFFYLDTDGPNSRLALVNLSSSEKTYLTPENLIVLEYKYIPAASRVYFFATDTASLDPTYFITDLKQLYFVDLNNLNIRLLADSKDYVNFEFDVSPDGKRLALTRSKITNNQTLSPRKLYLSSAHRSRFRTFWNKNIASGEIIFSPSSDAILGFNADLGYLLVPIETKLEQIVEFGWLEHLRAYGFNNQGSKLAFSTSNSIEGETNFITIFSRGNIRDQYFLESNTDFIEQVRFIPNSSKLAYLRNKDLSEHLIQILDLDAGEIVNITYDFKNLEYFSISPNGQYILAEVYDSFPGANYGPSLRFDKESFENQFYNTEIYLINITSQEKTNTGFTGRKPVWK